LIHRQMVNCIFVVVLVLASLCVAVASDTTSKEKPVIANSTILLFDASDRMRNVSSSTGSEILRITSANRKIDVAKTAGNRPMGQKKAVNGPSGSSGLEPMGNGTVYDANLGVFWLADANLAGDARVRKMLGADKLNINSDGTMDYQTALQWVNLLNKYNGEKGYLDHNKWQLPVTPAYDSTCSSRNIDSFGATCTGSALGNLYSVGLGKNFPDSVAPEFSVTVDPFENLQPSLYWTLDTNSGGSVTFSFLSQNQAANTPKYNFMHVLATIPGAIDNKPPANSGVVAYTSGKANRIAVYDATVKGGRTWILDANLPLSKDFGITGNTTIASEVNRQTLSVPKIDKDGAMLFETANDPYTGWIAAMNKNKYAGANSWALPHYQDLQTLAADLQLHAHDSRLVYNGSVGPFQNLQPFFYWACERDPNGDSQSPCDPSLNPPQTGTTPMRWSFNFDNGFQGTSESTKPFYVMVYYPARTGPGPGRPTPGGNCGTPIQCCVKAGGTWIGGRCE